MERRRSVGLETNQAPNHRLHRQLTDCRQPAVITSISDDAGRSDATSRLISSEAAEANASECKFGRYFWMGQWLKTMKTWTYHQLRTPHAIFIPVTYVIAAKMSVTANALYFTARCVFIARTMLFQMSPSVHLSLWHIHICRNGYV